MPKFENSFRYLNLGGVGQHNRDVGLCLGILYYQILSVSPGNQSVDLDFLAVRRAICQSDTEDAQQCGAGYDPSTMLLHEIVPFVSCSFLNLHEPVSLDW
jgi:hypothetical protein